MDIKIAGEGAKDNTKYLKFDPELCSRELCESNTCQACVDICPRKAISQVRTQRRPGGKRIKFEKHRCIDCGLCSEACPTGAFSWDNPTGLQFMEAIDITTKALPHEHVYLTCKQSPTKDDDPAVISVPCLGMISPETWAKIICDYRQVQVYLPSGLCAKCRIKTGEEAVVNNVSYAEELVGHPMPVAGKRATLDYMIRNADVDGERRDALTSLLNVGIDMVNDVMERDPSDPNALPTALEAADKHRAFLARELFKSAEEADEDRKRPVMNMERIMLAELSGKYRKLAARTPLKTATVEESKCTLCHKCVDVCPTQAMYIHGNSALVDAQFCIACNNCVDVCWTDAVEMVDRNAADIFSPAEEGHWILDPKRDATLKKK